MAASKLLIRVLANFANSAAQNGISDIDYKRVVLWIECRCGWPSRTCALVPQSLPVNERVALTKSSGTQPFARNCVLSTGWKVRHDVYCFTRLYLASDSTKT